MKLHFSRALLLFLFVSIPSWAPALTVTFDDNYPPYSFRDALGHSQGILIDEWKLWSQRTGEPVQFLPLPWKEALNAMASGKADVIDTIFLTPARTTHYSFTSSYASIETGVFHRTGLSGIQDLHDLTGYLVGVKAGDSGADALRDSGVSSLREFPSYEAIIDAAVRGEIHVFCMDVPPAQHFLIAKGMVSEFRKAFILAKDSFRRAVSKEKPEVLALVNRGFGLVTTAELANIHARWLGVSLPIYFSTRTILPLGGAVLALILLLTGLVVYLRLQVRRRQGQLVGTEAALRVSEDRARAMVEALPDLLFQMDSSGLILECRAPTSNRLYQNTEALVGKNLVDSFTPDLAKKAMEHMAEVKLTGGVGVMEAELPLGGRSRIFEARIVRMGEDRFLAIVRDISDTRQAWQNDLHRNKMESLGVLAGGLAHDFNNSLAVIQGFISLARIQLAQPDKAVASLDKAVQATRRAAGLTSQLRVLAHGSEVQRTLLSARELAEEAASFALVGAPCVLAIEADQGPWTVEADSDQLFQVFHNLVLNAVQAMPRGGTVTLVFRHLLGDKVSVSVVDEGAGIAEDNLSRIFDPYFTTKIQGSGLGLSVVHAVVQRHGGTLEVNSRLEVGTVFTVVMPAARGQPLVGHSGAPLGDHGIQGQKVLIMEDEGDIRDLLVEIANSLGLETTACRNGRDAVVAFDAALAAGCPFPLVISDLLVPGDMGGREMISLLRSRATPFRALAVTGFSADRSPEDFRNQGFDVIVGKPFTVDELKHRIVELMISPWKTEPNS